MKRESKVADATSLTLLHQIVHHAVVYIAAVKLVHTTTDGMQQVVVDIVDLQLLQRVLVHADAGFTALCGGVEVRQFGSHKIF